MLNFALAKEHRDYYKKNGSIEFNAVFSEKELEALIEGVDSVLSNRLHCSREHLHLQAPDALFVQGRDLWRDAPTLKKHLMAHSLAAIESELESQRSLRFGYDMYVPKLHERFSEKEAITRFLKAPHSLTQISAFQGVVGGVIIALEGTAPAPFPQEPGHIAFIKESTPLDFSLASNLSYLLIAYVIPNAVFIRNENDPHAHKLRDLGYNPGDRLKESTHPLLH